VSYLVSRKGNRRVKEIAPSGRADAQLSGHLIRAQEEERKRISRELHDETGQALMLLRLQVGMLANEVWGHDLQQRIQQITELLDRAIRGLRRIIGRLSPRILEQLGLTAAIRKQVRELEKNLGIKAELSLPEEFGDLAPEVEVAAYRCVQEALHNIAKHSQARNVTIRISNRQQKLILTIEDDGVGIPSPSHAHNEGFGLSGMGERVTGLEGTLRIHTSESGTRLRIMLPIAVAGSRGKQPPQTERALMKRTPVKRAS